MSCIAIISNHNDHKQVTIHTDQSAVQLCSTEFINIFNSKNLLTKIQAKANMDSENYDVCEKIINDIDAVFTKDPNL